MKEYEAMQIMVNAADKHYEGKKVWYSFFERPHKVKGQWVALFGTEGNPHSPKYDVNQVSVNPITKAVVIERV